MRLSLDAGIRLAFVLAIVFSTRVRAQPAPAAEVAAGRPNVILILTDDQGYGDLGITGNTILKTPNMDRLAGEGVMFRNFYMAPICAPSRASLLTGRYHQRTGVPFADGPTDVLRLREVTIAKALKSAGYKTALIGKWHLGRFAVNGPMAHGFDRFFGFRDGMIVFYNDAILEYNGKPVRTNGYVTDVLTDAALRFVEENRDQPFFLYLSYNAPHLPMKAPIRYEEPYNKPGISAHLAKLYGMITHLDMSIGRVLERLKELEIEDNTIVIFLSDNGMQKGTVGFVKSAESDRLDELWRGVDRFNAGLRGQKGTVYEGGIRVPFIARWPGRFPKGKVVNSLAAHIDVFPTILALADVPVPEGLQLDGKSIASILRSGEGAQVHEKLFLWCDPAADYRTSRMTYPKNNYAVRSGPWKLVKGTELYNLDEDPFESRNVIEQHREIARELKTAFDLWSEDVIPRQDLQPLPIPIDGEDTPSYGSNIFRGGTLVTLRWAQLHGDGGIRFAYNKNIRDRLTDWTSLTDYISWPVEVRREGLYDVVLQYGCPRSDAGSRIRIIAGDSTVEGVVESTPAIDVWQDWKVGTLRFSRETNRFTIRPLSVAGRYVMDLREVRLKWAGPE